MLLPDDQFPSLTDSMKTWERCGHRVTDAFFGSLGGRSRALYKELEACGEAGRIAAALLRIQKSSSRAKEYRGDYKGLAYQRKTECIGDLCRCLYGTANPPVWGWGADDGGHLKDVLYVDLPEGQVSFHASFRGVGPDYAKPWDGMTGVSEERILRFAQRVLFCSASGGDNPFGFDLGPVIRAIADYRMAAYRRGQVLRQAERIRRKEANPPATRCAGVESLPLPLHDFAKLNQVAARFHDMARESRRSLVVYRELPAGWSRMKDSSKSNPSTVVREKGWLFDPVSGNFALIRREPGPETQPPPLSATDSGSSDPHPG